MVAATGAGHRVLLLGIVQPDLATRPNSLLRAEVSKLPVHARARRQGLARQLRIALEAHARQQGRSTLVPDTRHGNIAGLLY